MKTPRRIDRDARQFYLGVVAALAIMAIHGQDTIYDEIVEEVGAEELIRVARRDGALKWSGLSDYIRRMKENAEFRRGMNIP